MHEVFFVLSSLVSGNSFHCCNFRSFCVQWFLLKLAGAYLTIWHCYTTAYNNGGAPCPMPTPEVTVSAASNLYITVCLQTNSTLITHGLEILIKLGPTFSLPVYLGVGLPSGAHDQILFPCLDMCGVLFLRGWVCNLLVQLLLGLARAVALGPKPRRTHNHILLSHLRLPQPGWLCPHICIP
jgi:hypothetical protein